MTTSNTINGKSHKDIKRKPAPVLVLQEFSGETQENNTPEKQTSLISDLRKSAMVDLKKRIVEPQNALEVFCNGSLSVFATLGNFSLIIGKAKSRKTFFISLLVAALICGRFLMGKLKSSLQVEKRKVLWFDTEQSEFHVQRVYQRSLSIAQITEAEDLEVYALRRFDTKTRLAIIEDAIYETEGLAMVIIDGIRDLVTDINSPEEATFISNKLLKWTEEQNIHIITILHQNKADNNARGHVGTELINKAESVLSIAKDSTNSEISVVTPEYFRDKEFKPFAFSIDDNTLPYIIEDWIGNEPKEPKRGKSAVHIDDTFHKARIREAWNIDPNPTYGFAWKHIKAAFDKHQRLNDNEAKDFLACYQKEGWITKIEPPHSGKKWATYQMKLTS